MRFIFGVAALVGLSACVTETDQTVTIDGPSGWRQVTLSGVCEGWSTRSVPTEVDPSWWVVSGQVGSDEEETGWTDGQSEPVVWVGANPDLSDGRTAVRVGCVGGSDWEVQVSWPEPG